MESLSGFELIFSGPWQDTLEMLSLKLEALTKGVTLMVTHQVIINAVTGASVGSGEFVAYNTDTKRRKVFRLD
ncbi:hypothetical protein N9V48_02425 [Planktomarina temperata]|nr:hypothetical protein [Planktomarina temperata]